MAVLGIGVAALALYEVVTRFGASPLIHALHATGLIALAVGFIHLGTPRPRSHSIRVLAVVLGLLALTSLSIAVINQATTTSTILFVGMSMGVAALLPIRWREQLTLVSLFATAYAVELLAVTGGITFEHGREAVAVAVAFVASILVTWQLEQHRASVAIERQAREARESELEINRAFLRQVIDVIPHGILAKDRDGRFTLINATIARAYGRTVDEMLGKRDADFHAHADEVERFLQADAAVFASGKAQHAPEETVTTQDGHERVLEITRHPIVDRLGKTTQVLAVAIDVTAHKQAIAHIAEEGRITARLADASAAIISSLNQPDLLTRLCEIATAVLDADFAQLWTWNPDTQQFAPATHFNFPDHLWEAARLLTVSRHLVSELAQRAEQGEISFRTRLAVADEIPASLLHAVESLEAFAVIPLRRGPILRGIIGIGYLRPIDGLSPSQRRIAEGLGQICSLAVENALLFDELGRANRLKSDFVATMSHELRTPLNVILGYLDLLMDLEFGPLAGEQVETLERVRINALHLLELINSTLDLSRLDAGRIPIHLGVIGAEEFAAAVREQAHHTRRNAGVEFRYKVEPGSLPLHSDVTKLKVIAQNLVRNALKFTHHGAVELEIASDAVRISLTVRDTGPGIPEATRHTIFGAFEQGDREIGARYGGVGLGLYIVRRLVETLGGSVELETAVGEGSTFTVTLPQLRSGDGTPQRA